MDQQHKEWPVTSNNVSNGVNGEPGPRVVVLVEGDLNPDQGNLYSNEIYHCVLVSRELISSQILNIKLLKQYRISELVQF